MGITREYFDVPFQRNSFDETNNGAEIQALIRGVFLRKRMGIRQIEIEPNSKFIVGWMTENHYNTYYL